MLLRSLNCVYFMTMSVIMFYLFVNKIEVS